MNKKIPTPQVIDIIELAVKECLRYESDKLYPQHYLLSLINTQSGIGYQILRYSEININELKRKLIMNINILEKINTKKISKITYSDEFNELMKRSEEISDELGSESISTEHTLLALSEINNDTKKILIDIGLDKNKIKTIFDDMVFGANNFSMENGAIAIEKSHEHNDRHIQQKNNKKISLLKFFGINLTELAKNGKLDNIVGREIEIGRMINVLSRMKKNNPLLLGDSGVGKTAILEGLALRIVKNNVPNQLKNKSIVILDLASLVAGTKYRGQFEERIKSIIKEVEENPNLILAIDEIHNMVSAGSAEGALDAANILKEPLSRGAFQCIGLTTWKEYRKFIEPDSALCRRFNIINISQPNIKETLEIVKGVAEKYQNYHMIQYSEDVLEYIVKLSDRYIHNKNFPDKAIDIMDEVGSFKKLSIYINSKNIKKIEDKICKVEKKLNELQRQEKWNECKKEQANREKLYEELRKEEEVQLKDIPLIQKTITMNDVANVVKNMTGIPVSHSEDNISHLKNIYTEMKNHIKGQDEAVDAICKAVLRGKTGLKSPNKPIATLLFAGKTGVGKTETARRLAQIMFGDQKALIREDMSSYSEKHSVSKMVGCFAKGNKVYEKNKGLVNIEEIKENDLVLTHKDRFQKVIKVHSYSHTGTIVRLKWMEDNDSMKVYEATCTPDHEFLTLKDGEKEPQWVKSQQLSYNADKSNDCILIPTNFKDEIVEAKDLIIPSAATIWTIIKYVGSFLSILKTGYELYKTIKNDTTINIKGFKKCKIVSKIFESFNDTVYDLSVEVDTSYTVSGAIVHNSPPGYVGYDEGGGLTNKVKQNPYSIILLDEAEKADRSVWELLLPMFEEGRLVDSKTNTSVDFRNTIIILTTNIGSQVGDIDSIGVNIKDNNNDSDYLKLKEKTKKSMEKVLSPEFLNRIDEIIVFRELSNDNLKEIINLLIRDYNNHIKDIKGFTIKLTEKLIEFLIVKGYSKKYGARELRRTFDSYVLDNFVEYYIALDGKISKNSEILCDLKEKEQISFELI